MNALMWPLLDDATLEAVNHLRPAAEQAELSMTETALAWVLRPLALASAIVDRIAPRASTPERQGIGH